MRFSACDDALELRLVDGERLLDKDVLACRKRLADERGVQVVAGDDEDGVDLGVGQDLAMVGGGVSEAEAPGDISAAQAGGGRDAMQLDAADLLQSWQEDALGEAPGADEADAALGGLASDRAVVGGEAAHGKRGALLGVGEEDAEVGLLPFQNGVGAERLADLEAVSDEGLGRDTA